MLRSSAFRARALLLGARLDLRNWPEGETLARAPLTARLAGSGIAVLFRFGVAVLFDAPPEAEQALRERLAPLTEHRYPSPELEELEVRIEPSRPEGLHEGVLPVQSASLERLQLVAEALAKSVKRIGALLLIESRMVSRAQIGDKPELLWEHPRLEGLNALLEDEFEIRERLAALDRKLELAARTERTLVDLMSTRHGAARRVVHRRPDRVRDPAHALRDVGALSGARAPLAALMPRRAPDDSPRTGRSTPCPAKTRW